MFKRFMSLILTVLCLLSPFCSAFAEDWGASPAIPSSLDFRRDGKYSSFVTFIGPGRSGKFSESDSHTNGSVSVLRGLWRESYDGVAYIYIEFRANPNFYRRVYVTNTYFSNVGHLPQVQLTGKAAVVTKNCDAWYGPGQEYNRLQYSFVSAGTKATVYFEEKGYVLADFINESGSVRAYLPADCVAGSNNAGGSTYSSYTSSSSSNSSANSSVSVQGVYCVECGYKRPNNATYKYCPQCGTPFVN